MKKVLEIALGYAVAGIFVFGVFAIAHYILKADDTTIMIFALWLIWSDLANVINRTDKETAK